jgi:hypothetical protein
VWFAALAVALVACPVVAQEKGKKQANAVQSVHEAKHERVEAEFKVKMLELELKLQHLATEQARIELRKVEQHLKAAKNEAGPRELEEMQLQMEQVALEVHSHEVKAEMAKLQLQFAKLYLERHAGTPAKKPVSKGEQPVPVKIEVDDDAGAIIIRGPQAGVAKIQAWIEKATHAKK